MLLRGSFIIFNIYEGVIFLEIYIYIYYILFKTFLDFRLDVSQSHKHKSQKY